MTYDPVTLRMVKVNEQTPPLTLLTLCRQTILTTVSLHRINKMEALGLPHTLHQWVSTLTLGDFHIQLNELSPHHHFSHTYPATVLFDRSKVLLRVSPPAKVHDPNHPCLLGSFQHQHSTVCVYRMVPTLRDLIFGNWQGVSSFTELQVWGILQGICGSLLQQPLPSTCRITPSSVLLLEDGHVYVDLIEAGCGKDENSVLNLIYPYPMVVYDAPENITRMGAGDKAFTWSIGCVLSEMLSIEPAYRDIMGTDPFQLYIELVQGRMPARSGASSALLHQTVVKCLQLRASLRPSLEELLHLAQVSLEPDHHHPNPDKLGWLSGTKSLQGQTAQPALHDCQEDMYPFESQADGMNSYLWEGLTSGQIPMFDLVQPNGLEARSPSPETNSEEELEVQS